MADSSRVSVRVAPEATWGVAPAGGPTWLEVPITSVTPRTNQETTRSAIIVSDAQVRALIRTAKSGAPEIGFELGYGWLDEIFAAGLRSDWQVDTPTAGTDRLENGTELKSLSIEVAFLDIGEFILFTGQRVNTLNLNVAVGSPITGTVTFLGKGGTISSTSTADAFTPAADVAPINSVDHITLFDEGGTTLADALGFDLALGNAGRVQSALGSVDPRGIGLGQIGLTGTVTAYFDDSAVYQKFLNFTESSVDFQVTGEGGSQLLFNIFALRYTGGDPDVGGNNEDVDIAHAFEAYRDATTGKTIRIERTP